MARHADDAPREQRVDAVAMGRDPERVLRLAVKGMLPKGRLGRQMLKKLRVYAGPTHPHQAQAPKARALASR